MSTPRINFIGCGRLGKTLASLFKNRNVAKINGILCSTMSSTLSTVKFIGDGIACESINKLPAAEIYFIATRDDIISNVCDELVNNGLSDAIIVHFSGSLSSEILSKAKSAGCHIVSIHPLKSFANLEESIRSFSGTYCAIEGDDIAISVIKDLFLKIDANVFQINKNKKSLYHAACVIANNYMVTLHYIATQCYESVDIDKKIGSEIVSRLALEAIKNIDLMNHEKALTGPMQRGDAGTIQNHTSVLSHVPVIQEMYKTLGLATLSLTNHPKIKRQELEEILTKKLNL